MRKVWVGLGLVGTILVAALPVSGQPTFDSVVGAGAAGFCTFEVEAQSGPNGESPQGFVSFDCAIGPIEGNVTQLCVSGNEGIVSGQVVSGPYSGSGYNFYVRDNGQLPERADALRLELLGYIPSSCPEFNLISPAGVSAGDVIVTDGIQNVIEVAIDFKPGNDSNTINPRNQGKIVVAILSNDGFDAAMTNPDTVTFGATGKEAAPVWRAMTDVDGDGHLDLALRFNTEDTGIQCGDTAAFLSGETYDGEAIEGFDFLRTVGCR